MRNTVEAIGEHLKSMGHQLADAKLRILELEAELARAQAERLELAELLADALQAFTDVTEAHHGDTK